MTIFDCDKDRLPDGPILVTGATGAIGAEIVRELVRLGRPVIMAVRSQEKYQKIADEIKESSPDASLRFAPLDLNSSVSVAECVRSLNGVALAAIVNNAGIMCRKFTLSPDGPETTLNVNYFNTRRLNELLLPQVSDGGAIVFTTSITRFAWPGKNIPEEVTERAFGQLRTYALSKKLITRFALGLARNPEINARGIRVNCCDPGVVDSGMITMHRWFDPLADIFFRPFIRKPQSGAIPALRALFLLKSGRIFTLRHDHGR